MDLEKKLRFRANVIYFSVVASFVLIRICANYNLFSFLGVYGSYYLSILTQVGLIFLLPLLLFKKTNKIDLKTTFKVFSFKLISLKSIICALLLGVVVFFLNVYVSNFFFSVITFFGYKSSPAISAVPATWWTLVLDLFCTAILPAICEETLHRGMMLRANASMGLKKSIIISGFLFGLLHLNIEQFFYASIIGIFLGYVCWTSCSIYPCMIVHFMNNALATFLSFARKRGWAIGGIFEVLARFFGEGRGWGILMFLGFLILLVFLGHMMVKYLIKDSFNFNFVSRQKELAQMAVRENYLQSIENLKNEKKTENELFSTDKNMLFVDAKEFLEFVNQNMDRILKEANSIEKENNVPLDSKTKIFMWGSFVLSGIITIMTFIWGLF